MRYSVTVISNVLRCRGNADMNHVMTSTDIPVFMSSLNTSKTHFLAHWRRGHHFISSLTFLHLLIIAHSPCFLVFRLLLCFMLMLACCIAWGACTDLILLQHVRYALRFNLLVYWLMSCSCELSFFHLQHIYPWAYCWLIATTFSVGWLCLIGFITHHSSCAGSCSTHFSAISFFSALLSALYSIWFSPHGLVSCMKVNGLRVFKCYVKK